MKDVIKELFPPGLPPVAKWRMMHFILGVVMITFMLWTLGAFAMAGFPGFVRADDAQGKGEKVNSQLAMLSQEVKNIKIDQLEQRIYDIRRLQCTANSSDSTRFYTEQITKMHRAYFELTGITLNLPECREVGG